MEKNIVIGKSVQSFGWRVQGLIKRRSNSNENLAKNKRQAGFSLLELLIAMFILIILLAVALPTYQRSIQHAREVVLEENLFQMRRAIDQYTTDKGKAPQTLDDLIEAKYMREVPKDPISEESKWQEIQGDDPNSSEGDQGLIDVKSLAEGEDSTGKKYSEY
jgi:general secretion pathway protein G